MGVTLECESKSWFSWEFDVRGAASGDGEVRVSRWTETGSLVLGGKEYEVVKHGMFSGTWTLEHDGEVVATAIKPNPMTRRFAVEMERGGGFVVCARSVFTRGFDVIKDDEVVGSILPAGIFSLRATIECESKAIPEIGLLFSFWLYLLMQKRNKNNC